MARDGGGQKGGGSSSTTYRRQNTNQPFVNRMDQYRGNGRGNYGNFQRQGSNSNNSRFDTTGRNGVSASTREHNAYTLRHPHIQPPKDSKDKLYYFYGDKNAWLTGDKMCWVDEDLTDPRSCFRPEGFWVKGREGKKLEEAVSRGRFRRKVRSGGYWKLKFEGLNRVGDEKQKKENIGLWTLRLLESV